jgi:hypothetical protein
MWTLGASEPHVLAVDASCSCGAEYKGAWSGAEIESWYKEHLEECDEEDD